MPNPKESLFEALKNNTLWIEGVGRGSLNQRQNVLFILNVAPYTQCYVFCVDFIFFFLLNILQEAALLYSLKTIILR